MVVCYIVWTTEGTTMLEMQNLAELFEAFRQSRVSASRWLRARLWGSRVRKAPANQPPFKIITGMRGNEGWVLVEGQDARNQVVVTATGNLLADAPPAELMMLMRLPTLESAFVQLVQQQDVRSIAQAIVAVMQLRHA